MAPELDRPQPSGETLRFMQRLWDVVHAMEVRSKRMARTIGVTSPQRLVIRIIGQSPNIVASDIAATLGIHPSTLTGILQRLQRHKLIARRADPEDRRRVRFTLTPAGRHADRARRGTVEAAVRRALVRAGEPAATHTAELLELLAAELARDD